jgi:hypothetical protein
MRWNSVHHQEFKTAYTATVYVKQLLLPAAIGEEMDYTGCPTCYQTRHFFNNSNTNEDIATKFEQQYVMMSHFSHNEHTPVQISLQYRHWC